MRGDGSGWGSGGDGGGGGGGGSHGGNDRAKPHLTRIQLPYEATRKLALSRSLGLVHRLLLLKVSALFT